MNTVVVTQKVAIYNSDKKILVLTRPSDDSSRPDGLDLPGGGIEFGEDPKIALLREVKEETGLDVDLVKPITVDSFIGNNDQFNIFIGYQAKATSTDISLSDEHSSYKWFTRDDILQSGLPERYKKVVNRLQFT